MEKPEVNPEHLNAELSLWDKLNTLRLSLFLETEPQSNKYRHIPLTKAQFLFINSAICKPTGRKMPNSDIDEVEIVMSNEIHKLPDVNNLFE
jgi:hypothetical protein